MLRACWRNFVYILNHKMNVLVECWLEGLYLQGITHDLSKFSPKEFFPYAKKFFLDKELNAEDELKWNYAWLHHQHKNKHHWEYWVVNADTKQALPMPRKYLKEMVCDWRSLSRSWGRRVKEYDMILPSKIILHPDTKKELEILIMTKSTIGHKKSPSILNNDE
jgi:hypothetical protein